MTSSTFCPLPWISLAIRNNGDYRVCCHANTSPGAGLLKDSKLESLNAKDTSISEARNSMTLKNIRTQMLNNEWPSSCSRCKNEELAGIRSKRIYSQERLSQKITESWARSVTDGKGNISPERVALHDLDIRFGNKCNLSCRMCGPADSSSWVEDYKKLGNPFREENFDWYESESFWNSLNSSSSNLDHIYIVGGEPLLIDRHFKYLENLVEQDVAKNLTLEYNTNLSVLPDRVLHLWSFFKKVRIGVSIDGVGAVNDYIRHPSKFSILEKNLSKLDRGPENLQPWLALTVSIYNIHHLVQMMKWVHSKKFLRIGATPKKEFFVPHPVHKPDYLNIQSLPLDKKMIVQQHLNNDLRHFFDTEDLSEAQRLRADRIIHQYLNFMLAGSLDSSWGYFKKFTKDLDKIRHQDWRVLNSPILSELQESTKGSI